MRRMRFVVLVAAAALGLAACGSGDDTSSGSETSAATSASGATTDSGGTATEVEVFTWWSSGSEAQGLDALVGVLADQHPDVKFVNGAVAGGGGSSKSLLQDRLAAGDPPDSFQAHAGKEMADYIASGQVQDITNLYSEFGLNDVFPKDLVNLLTSDGKIYSIPSNIHRANVLWASVDVLQEAGLDPTAEFSSWDDFFTALDKVKATGKTALSIATTWTQVHLLETVLIGELGTDAYNGLWDGTTDWTSAEVTKALEVFDKLMSYTNTDRDGLDWSDSTQMLIDDEAGFNVMGDWAVALFNDTDQVAGTDYVHAPTPGSDGVFDFLADSFTLTEGAPHPDGAKAWLETIASVEGQTAFNQIKGSIPARTDIDMSTFSEYQQGAMDSFKSDTIVPSLQHGAASTIAQLNDISDAVSAFTSGASDLATFQSDLAAAMTS